MKIDGFGVNASALPYLDTIETTQNSKTSEKPICIKGSEDFFTEKKYEDIQQTFNENNSNAIKSAEYYKHLTDELAGLLIYEDSILQERAEKMLDCGTFFEMYDDKIISANFCRQRICPNCQRRRALKTCVDTLKMQKLLSEKGYKYLHLVLTVPNCSAFELSETLDKLFRASSKFFKLPQIKNKFKGVMRCLEVTYNGKYRIHSSDDDIHGNCFHPHLHCLVAVSRSYGSGKNYLSHALITGLWMDCVGTSDFLNTYIASVKNGDEKAVAEIAKYCVKPLELSCPASERRQVFEILFQALHGRRLLQLYGEFRSVARQLHIDTESLVDDIKELDEKKIHRYTYNRRNRSYELSGAI